MWLANKHKGHNKFQNKLFSWLVTFEMSREGSEDHGRLQFVITDKPDHSWFKVNFTKSFNPNHPARLGKSFNSMYKGDGFPAKTLGKAFFIV